MNINKKEIERQYSRIKSAGWLPWFQEAARKADTSTAHFLAIGSRETNLKNIRGDFRNGRWNGFGVMQVDVGTDPDYARNWTPDKVEPSIRRGGEIYASKADQVFEGQGKRLKVRGNTFTGKKVEPDDLRRIATAAYNSGLWPYYHFSRGANVDSTTTGHDYSRDVYDRSIEFADLLKKDGTESDALTREVELQGKYASATARKLAGLAEDAPDSHLPLADAMEDQSELARADYASTDSPSESTIDGNAPEKETTVSDKTNQGANSAPAADDTVRVTDTNPTIVEVKSPGVSMTTKIASAAGPVGTALTALGIKLGGIQVTQGTIYAMCAVALVAILASAYIYNKGKDREQERLKLSMANLADRQKNNVVAANSGA